MVCGHPLKTIRAKNKKDIFENKAIKTVSETNNYLTENGYSVQVNPREINVFYTDNNLRERIELRGDKYCINNR